MVRRIVVLGLIAAIALAGFGCSAGGGRGKNKDLDRPSSADTKK
jgi:hypothetical protein